MKLAVVLCVLAAGAFAQTPTPTPTDYSDSDAGTQAASRPLNEKPQTLDEIKQRTKANKTKDDLIFAYDKFRDESIIVSKPENLVGSWEGAAAIIGSSRYGSPGTPLLLFVGIETRFAGQTLKETPDKFALVFDGMSPDWQFLKTGSTLFVLLDGEGRIRLEAATRDHDVKRWNRVDEKIAYVVTRPDLERITRAAKVEIRIGDGQARVIKPKVLKRWRSVLDATQLEAGKE